MKLEVRAVESLIENGWTISIAESCTGGLISKLLTDVPGSSQAFLEAVVAYSNDAKVDILGVPAETIENHGAVSKETAVAMAMGVKARSGSDIGLSTTCIAGPGGATPGKDVGLSYIAVDPPIGKPAVIELQLSGCREWVRWRLAEISLQWVADPSRIPAHPTAPNASGSLIIVGDEVLSGLVMDSNAKVLAELFRRNGVPIDMILTVPDDPERIREALARALRGSSIVAISGGLGPTPDDRTVEAISIFLDAPLDLDGGALAMMERRYAEGCEKGVITDPAMNESRMKMAFLPRGTEVLVNDEGYGPGLAAWIDGRTIMALPGVPSELAHMAERHLSPHLASLGREEEFVEETVYAGGESTIAPLLRELIDAHSGVRIGSYPDLASFKTTIRISGAEEAVLTASAKLHKWIADREGIDT